MSTPEPVFSLPPAPERRVSRKGLYIPLALLALVIAGWTGAWVFAKSKAGDLMDAWIAREARLGRQWTCPDRDIGGYPFRIDVSCLKPTFVSTQEGRAGQGALAGLAVTARVMDPKQIIAVFSSPLSFSAATGETVNLTFANARASYRGTPSDIDQTSIEIEKPVLSFTAPGYQPLEVSAARTDAHIRRAPVADPATDIAVAATEIRSDLFNALSAETAPGNIDLRARLTRFAPAPPRDWRETLETWRRADGEASIERISLSKGPIALNLAGSIRLDDQRRPVGEITGTAAGAAQLMRAFGIEIGGGGGLLGSLLGGGQRTAPNAPQRALPFTLRMDNGRMFIGPIPGPRLRPLYGYN